MIAVHRWAWWMLFLGARMAAGETIFATDGETLFHLDADSPETPGVAVPIAGAVPAFSYTSLEIDAATGTLFGFTTEECLFVCPPMLTRVQTIDPWSGETTDLDWPGQPLDMSSWDKDFDPARREFRILNPGGQNLRFSLAEQQFFSDTELDSPGEYVAIAHRRAEEGGSGVETFALRRWGERGFELVRIGGAGGDPPASSGEVHPIGALAVAGEVSGFDVSPAGIAYLVSYTFVPGAVGGGPSLANRLYAVDLATASVEELGALGVPGGSRISGIAIAPDGGAVAVPSLSGVALGVLALALAVAGVRRARASPDGQTTCSRVLRNRILGQSSSATFIR